MLTVNQYALYMALQTVKHAMPKNDIRKYLNGIHLKREGEALAVTTTDGHRIAQCAVTVDAGNDFELTICAKKLPQILAFIKCNEGTSTIELDVTNSTLGGLAFDVIECDRYPNVEMQFLKFANSEPVKLNGMSGKYLTDMSRAFTALSKYGVMRMTICSEGAYIEGHSTISHLGNARSCIASVRI